MFFLIENVFTKEVTYLLLLQFVLFQNYSYRNIIFGVFVNLKKKN